MEPSPQSQPPPETLSPQQMQQIILSVRQRVQKNEVVSDDEIRYAVRLIPLVRAGDAKRSSVKKEMAAAPSTSLEDF